MDLVYLWLDGSRPDHLELRRRYSTEPDHLNPERYRDQFSMLKYSLRSVERFAPWVRGVYLVTPRPQVPEWLDPTTVTVVHQEDLFENPEYLPTFSSDAVESHLDRVPTATDPFVYLNDDCLFGQPTTVSDFVTPSGEVRVLGAKVGRERWEDWLNFPVRQSLEVHAPLVVQRALWRSMLETFSLPVEEIRRSRFRLGRGVRKMYRHQAMAAGAEVVPLWRFWPQIHFHKITNNVVWQVLALGLIRRFPRKFLCLNDDLRGSPNPRVEAMVREFLESVYPVPSRYESRPPGPGT